MFSDSILSAAHLTHQKMILALTVWLIMVERSFKCASYAACLFIYSCSGPYLMKPLWTQAAQVRGAWPKICLQICSAKPVIVCQGRVLSSVCRHGCAPWPLTSAFQLSLLRLSICPHRRRQAHTVTKLHEFGPWGWQGRFAHIIAVSH
jgi:hypothetical protein